MKLSTRDCLKTKILKFTDQGLKDDSDSVLTKKKTFTTKHKSTKIDIIHILIRDTNILLQLPEVQVQYKKWKHFWPSKLEVQSARFPLHGHSPKYRKKNATSRCFLTLWFQRRTDIAP